MFLGKIIWPPVAGAPMPDGSQLILLGFLSLVEALLFGLGVAFIVFAWPLVKKTALSFGRKAWLAYISLAWLLVSWWPHDNLHMHNGFYLPGLIAIDYGFHLTIIAATLVLTYFFVAVIKAWNR